VNPVAGDKTVRDAVDAYIKHRRTSRVGRAELRETLRILNRFEAKMGEERLLTDIELREVRAFAVDVGARLARSGTLDDEGMPYALQGALEWWRLQGWLGF
jgi:hypothetical protein